MLGIIAFVAACLLWQAIKNAFRGKPKMTITVGGLHAVADCGCEVEMGEGWKKVTKPCQAHKLLSKATNS
jgi:hypothetical protein